MASWFRIVAGVLCAVVSGVAGAVEPVAHPDPADFAAGVGEALREGIDEFEARRAAGADLASAYGQLGELYLAHHLTAAAESALEQAAKLAPDEFRWQYLLAFVRQEQGDLDAAIRGYARALELEPGYLPTLLHLGNAELAAGDPEAARRSFTKALETEPRSAAALAGLGRVAVQEQDDAAAIRRLEQALAIEPAATALYYPLALAYRDAGDRDRARALMARRGERQPEIADSVLASVAARSRSVQDYLERGYAAMRENRPAQAIEEFRQAVSVSPNDVSARASLAQALAAVGKTRAAMAEIDRAIELDPDYAPARYRKAALLERSGDLDAATAQYRKAIELDPDYEQARLLLAYALMRREDFAAAAEQFAELSARQPGSVIVRYRLGLARLAAGDCDGAQPPLEEARQLDPRAGEILTALARTYATCASADDEKRRTALEAARLLYEALPEPEQAVTLAMALAANGRFDQAAELQARAIEAERAAAQPQMLAALEEDLGRYQAGETADRPWPEQAAVFDPPRLDAVAQ
ncbi:hypothetical protein BH24PSE2_BH24PSE2_02520 [soil metagenome]